MNYFDRKKLNINKYFDHMKLSVLFALTRYRVLKIAHSCSKVVLQTTKHTMVYPSSGPSLEVIALRPTV
jgi:hypothetical protein